LGSAETQADYYTQIENIYKDSSDSGLSSDMSNFFDSLNDYSNNVENEAVRVSTLNEADAFAATLNQTYSRLDTIRTNANEEVRNTVPQINDITKQIATLNTNIRDAEVSGNKANDLRDQRDLLVDQLSKIINITSRERDDGQLDVQVGGVELISGPDARQLTATVDSSIDPNRSDLLSVEFADNSQKVLITNGQLYGTLQIRDTELPSIEGRLDTLAKSLIHAMNTIQSQGAGSERMSSAITSTNAVASPYAPLNSTLLPYSVSDGSFKVNVYDSTGALAETVNVPIVASGASSGQTTLSNIESAINGSAHMTAIAQSDGTLKVTPQSGYTYTFSNDTSGVLSAIGLNSFFTGTKASDIAVNSDLMTHPQWLSSGYNPDPLSSGDNSAALDLASVRNAAILENNTQTASQYYASGIVEVGISAKANANNLTVQQSFVDDFNERRQEVSGVNLDEEVTNLLLYQRAYQASARIISTADQMLQTLIGMVQ
jgi:flagellar hook-associated protein 1 FlgK